MGTHTTYEEKDTGWKTPGTVKQYYDYGKVNSATCYAFSDLNNIKKEDSKYAYIPTSGGVNNSHNSPRVYCFDFGFGSIIPSNAIITGVYVYRRVRKGTSDNGHIEDKLLKVRTANNNTNTGTGSDFHTSADWPQDKSLHEWTSGNMVQSLSTSTVRSDNFGCVYQCGGVTNSIWCQPKIDVIAMKVKYKVPITTWVDPIFTMDSSLDRDEIMDDGTVNAKLSIVNTNTNNESGTLPSVTVEIQNKNKFSFSDGSFVKTINSRSTSANAVITDTLELVGFEEGVDSIVISCGNNTVTETLSVERSVTEPKFEATVETSTTIKKYGISTVTITIDETNTFPGTLSNIKLTANEKLKFIDGLNLVNSIIIPSSNFTEGESKSYNLLIQGAIIGNGDITIENNEFGTINKSITVTSPDPVVSIVCDCPSEIDINEDTTVNYTLKNIGEVPANLTTLIVNSTNTLKINGSTTKTININSTLNVGSELTKTIIIKGLATDDCVLNAVLTELSENSVNVSVKELAEYSENYSLNTNEVNRGQGFVLSGNWTNVNNKEGYTPEVIVNLPEGVTTFNGQSQYTFPRQKVGANQSITQTVQLVSLTAGNKTITIHETNLHILVDEITSQEPMFSEAWCYVSNTNVHPSSGVNTGTLTIKYVLLNDVNFTVPSTRVTISGGGISINNSSSVIYPAQTFQSHGIITQNYTFNFVKEAENIITVSNEYLGTKTFKIISSFEGAEFYVVGNVSPNNVRLDDTLNLQIKTTNHGDKTDTCTNTIVLNGGVLSFDKDSLVTTKKLSSNTIPTGETIIEPVPIYALTAGTGSITISNDKTNFITNPSVVTVAATTSDELIYSMNVTSYRLPAWTGDESAESTQIKVKITNLSNLTKNSDNLKIVLDNGLTFLDGSSEYILPSQRISTKQTKTVNLPQKVKSSTVKIEGYTIHLRDSDDMDIASCKVIITNPTPINKGWIEIKNCQFNNNTSAKGTIYSEGKIVKGTNSFKDNSSTNCPYIWNNGVCEQ